MFSGRGDESVRFRDVRVDARGFASEADKGIVGKGEDWVRCLTVSESSSRVSACCEDGTSFIWEKACEDRSTSYGVLSRISSLSVSDWFNGVAIRRLVIWWWLVLEMGTLQFGACRMTRQTKLVRRNSWFFLE